MSTLGISYTAQGGTSYNFVLDNFGDNAMPRSYVSTATFDTAASGSVILGGPAHQQKYQWVISTIMQTVDALQFDAMFRSWDYDRAAGHAAACGVNDETFGLAIATSAVFVTPPTYTRMGPQLTLVSFGLQEA
jgi:hypothetical protein